jgi:hypothetical protein
MAGDAQIGPIWRAVIAPAKSIVATNGPNEKTVTVQSLCGEHGEFRELQFPTKGSGK